MPRLAPLVAALAALAVAPPIAAQVTAPEVSVEADRRSMTLDDDVSLTITMSGTFDRYSDPSFDGFEVLHRGQSQQIQIINGVVSRQQVLRFELSPRRAGTFTVGAVQLLAAGRVVAKHDGVELTVRTPRAPPPATGDVQKDLAAKAQQTLFLHAETARSRVYVGEPFALSWNLYWRPEVNVQSAEITHTPTLEGLLAEELLTHDDRPRVGEKRVAGRLFSYVPRSVQLVTGLAPGRATIDAMTVRAVAGDFFRQRRVTVRSQPMTLEILPIPTEGRPEAWQDGNVGRFNLAASLRDDQGAQPTVVTTGQRLVMEVVLSGEGSLLSVKPPVLSGGDAFEVQALRGGADDVIEKDVSGMHGKRVFRWLLTPLKPGTQATPTARFAYFDPADAEFRTLEWPSTQLTVEGHALGGRTERSVLAGDDIGPLIAEHTLRRSGPARLSGTALFWGLLALPFAAWLAVEVHWLARRRALADPAGRRARGALANARKRLRLAERVMRDGLVKDFYGQVGRALVAWFEERANLAAQGMTWDELRQAAVDAGYSEELLTDVVVELENCDFARFAPAADADARMRETLERTRKLLARLDAVEPRRAP